MLEPQQISMGVKDVVEIGSEKVQERFGLGPTDGAAQVYVGDFSEGLRGGGFLYTNRDSIALGMVVGGDSVSMAKIPSHEPIRKLRAQPKIQQYLAGGKTIEYDAHMIPEAGPKMLVHPYTNGMIVAGDAAGHLLNNGYTFRGVDMAIEAGIAAGETILDARKAKDYSVKSLANFEIKLKKNPALKDMYTFSRVPDFLRNRRLYTKYPELICSVAEAVYRVDGTGKKKIFKELRQQTKGRVSTVRLIRDLMNGARTF
jgi:electron transfer flavoprotein-quinone oxidoreductase